MGFFVVFALFLLFLGVYAKLYHGRAFKAFPPFHNHPFLRFGDRVLREKVGISGAGGEMIVVFNDTNRKCLMS